MDIVDGDLLARYRETRDEQAFADLVGRYQALVQSACRRVLSDPSAVDDVVQETFWRLAERSDEVTTSLSGWLHATATRLAIDWLRRDRRSWRSTGSASAIPALAVPAADEAPAEVCRQVLDAVEDLPGGERDLIVRHYLLGATLGSLAALTGTPATTIHRRLHQGLATLRETLRRRGVETPLGCGLLLLITGSPWPRPGITPAPDPVPAAALSAVARPAPSWRRIAAQVALAIGVLALLLAWSTPAGSGRAASDPLEPTPTVRAAAAPAEDLQVAGMGGVPFGVGVVPAGDALALEAGVYRGHGATPDGGAGVARPPLTADSGAASPDRPVTDEGGRSPRPAPLSAVPDALSHRRAGGQASLAPSGGGFRRFADRIQAGAGPVPGPATADPTPQDHAAGRGLSTLRITGDPASP